MRTHQVKLFRSYRENKGARIEQLEMIFYGKTYKTAREYILLMNKKDKDTTKDEQSKDYMKMATYVIFTKMSAKSGIKKWRNSSSCYDQRIQTVE